MTDRTPRGGAAWALLLVAVALFIMLLQGCTVGPSYKRPDMDLPKDLGVAQSSAPASAKWWGVFNDPALERLEEEALGHNHDLAAAAQRIEQARAQLSITRSDQLPSVGVEATRTRSRSSEIGALPIPSDFVLTNDNRFVARLSWELDFWGKYRRATEAARADLLASEAGRDAVRSSLVSDLARGYFALLALDRRLTTLERNRAAWSESLDIQKKRMDAGAVSELEYRQIESELRANEALIPPVRLARSRQESALAVLLGRSPRDVYAGNVEHGEATLPSRVEVPAGVPSDLLLRRADLRQAEAQLHAANARIGVARAAYFPDISLTGFFGGESQALRDLFTGPARTWSLGGDLLQPLFAGGQLRGGVDLADARTKEAAELYRKAVANAFKEVRDAITAQTELREAANAQAERERSFSRTLELARLRYDNGAIGLFELLDTERQLLAARLDAIDAERDRRDAIVELYTALGA
ncbi:MAG TPA: efflux transporter outer membrane subunit [Usitatibacter sp.]|nr:efflux transporter outer membrane subunit [Usitatibacter sp.]